MQITICIDRNGHDVWEVAVPAAPAPVRCETFDDARRVAYLYVAHRRACELIIRDADRRVIGRERIGAPG